MRYGASELHLLSMKHTLHGYEITLSLLETKLEIDQ